jgi:hypothetical protein
VVAAVVEDLMNVALIAAVKIGISRGIELG